MKKYKFTKEHRERIRKSLTGRKLTKEHAKKISLSKIGKPSGTKGKHWKMSEEGRKKVKESHVNFWLGKKFSVKHRKKISLAHKGKLVSKETGRKISKLKLGKPLPSLRGINHPNWKGGVTPVNKKIRKSLEYKNWRRAVFERDNWTCMWCGVRNGNGKKVYLNADHIKPFALFIELRLVLENGRTLCINCHKKTKTYGNTNKGVSGN